MSHATLAGFVDGLFGSHLLDPEQWKEVLRLQTTARDSRELAQELLRRDWLTAYQINQIFLGKGAGLVLGPYVLIERLGEGGMGQVYRARQKMLNRLVALKVIRNECLDNPKAVLRFQREIRAASQLCHPHIVRAYDADQVNGTYYFAMELIEGADLSKIVKEQGPLRVDQACEYIRQAALGLQHAFERGLVHRDIKPANLLVTRAVKSDRHRSSGAHRRPPELNAKKSSGTLPRIDLADYRWGVIKILDMGLARCSDPFTGRSATHLTQVGSVMGTPEYIAPEQARDSHSSDIRADLYGLGCTLYFLLTGQPPFPTGTLTEKLLQHQFDVPEPVGRVRRERLLAWQGPCGPAPVAEEMLRVPAEVENLIARLMAKQPSERPQTPQELANSLQILLQKMADGTLPRTAKELITTTELPILSNPAGSGMEMIPGTSATIIQPMAARRLESRRGGRPLGKLPMLLAVGGGVLFVVLVSVISAFLSRNNRTQAGVIVADPATRNPVTVEADAGWKRLVKKALSKQGTWDEARLEMRRQRAKVSADSPQARAIDLALAQMPSAFDELDRTKFTGMMPAWMPTEIVGAFGLARPGVIKPVASLAISPSGRWLVCPEDNSVRIFDLIGAPTTAKKRNYADHVNQVAFSPDGRLAADAGEDGIVRVWDASSHSPVFSSNKHGKAITQLAFNHDGTALASAAQDGTIRVWDPRTGGELRKLDHQTSRVLALAFSSDGKTIFWSGGPEIRWTAVREGSKSPGGKFDTKLGLHRTLAFQPHGDLAVVGGSDGSLHVCTWDGTALVGRAILKQHQVVHQVAFAPDGKSFVSAGNNASAIWWNAGSLKAQKIWSNLRTMGHSVAFAPDGRHFVLGGAHNQAYVVRLADFDGNALKSSLE